MNAEISEFVYVGDGEWDLEATEKLGWEFIGVGERLKGECDVWVPDLSDISHFMKKG